MSQQSLFEGYKVQDRRVSISGGFATVDGATVPKMRMGKRVRMLVEGEVTAVKHKIDKDGKVERQHVVVLDKFTFGEGFSPDDEEEPEDEPDDLEITISTPGHEPVETTTAGMRSLTEKLQTGEVYIDANGEAQHI